MGISAGIVGFKGAKKRTPWAARTLTSRLVKKASRGMRKDEMGRKSSSPHLLRGAARWIGPPIRLAMIWLSGPGHGRHPSLRAILHLSVHRRFPFEKRSFRFSGGGEKRKGGRRLGKKGLKI